MPPWQFRNGIQTTSLFLSGKTAMATDTRYFLPQFHLQKNQDKLRTFNFDVCELPRGSAGRATTFVQSNDCIPACVAPERKKMAWDYVKFHAGIAGQRAIARMNTSIPSRMSVAYEMIDHPGVPPEHDRAFIDGMKYMRNFYWPFPTASLSGEINGELMSVWTGWLDAEYVCKHTADKMTRAVAYWHENHPGEKMPVKTKWVPFEKRALKDAAAAASRTY